MTVLHNVTLYDTFLTFTIYIKFTARELNITTLYFFENLNSELHTLIDVVMHVLTFQMCGTTCHQNKCFIYCFGRRSP